MIEDIKDIDGKVIAYVDWKLVDRDYALDNRGIVCWVDNYYTHPSLGLHEATKRLSEKVLKVAPWIEYILFQRAEKYGEDSWKLYKLDRILRRIYKSDLQMSKV